MAAPRREDMRKGIVQTLTTALALVTSDKLDGETTLEAELDKAQLQLQAFVVACEDIQGKYISYPKVVQSVLKGGVEAWEVSQEIQIIRTEEQLTPDIIAGWLLRIRAISLTAREKRDD